MKIFKCDFKCDICGKEGSFTRKIRFTELNMILEFLKIDYICEKCCSKVTIVVEEYYDKYSTDVRIEVKNVIRRMEE